MEKLTKGILSDCKKCGKIFTFIPDYSSANPYKEFCSASCESKYKNKSERVGRINQMEDIKNPDKNLKVSPLLWQKIRIHVARNNLRMKSFIEGLVNDFFEKSEKGE